MSLWTSRKFVYSTSITVWMLCVFWMGEYHGIHKFTNIAKDLRSPPDWSHLAENFTEGSDTVEGGNIEISPYTFRLKPGSENIEADEAIIHYHMNQTARGIMESKNHTSIALANYFAAIVNMTDKDVKKVVATSINSFLHTFNCPKWDLQFDESVEYVLCDCSHTTVKDWMRAVEEKQTTNDCTISSNHSDNLLMKAAFSQVHKCNAQFAWSLLTMLFVEHGPNAGVQYFRSGYFKLYYEVLDLHKNPNATKLSLANNFTAIVEKHLHEGVAEGHYLRMDIIVTALNNMHKYDKASWLSRFQYSMADAFESRKPKEEPKKENRVRTKEEILNDEAPLIIGIIVVGLILLFVVKFFWHAKIKAYCKRCMYIEEDPEDGHYEMAMVELGQIQNHDPNQDSNQDPEAPTGSQLDDSGFRSTPKRNSATESESEPAESLDQYQGPLCTVGTSGFQAIPMKVQAVTPSGSGTAPDLEPVNRGRVMSLPSAF